MIIVFLVVHIIYVGEFICYPGKATRISHEGQWSKKKKKKEKKNKQKLLKCITKPDR